MTRRHVVMAFFAGMAVVALPAMRSVERLVPGDRQSDQCAARLATFDTLDFDVFSNQKWDRLSESHAANIIVSWPDGHDTRGLQVHTSDLSAMFV